jgi:hypothetical protein
MDKEQWKNDVMVSLHGIKRAEPNPFLFTRIEAAITNQVAKVTPKQWRLAIAFSIVILILNGWLISRDSAGDMSEQSPYQLNNHRYQLY